MQKSGHLNLFDIRYRMIEWLELDGKSIKGFPLSGNTKRKFPVYLPPQSNKSQEIPVLYFLAAWGNRAHKYLSSDSVFGVDLESQFDLAITQGDLPPCVLVFPEMSTPWGSSQFINSPSLGNYQDYLCNEVVPFVESTLQLMGGAKSRAVLGHSSGGFGALHACFDRPEIFPFACSASGDSFFEVSLLPLVSPALLEIQRAGSVESFLKDFLEHPNPGSLGYSKMMTMMLLSLAPCYAPRPNQPPLYGEIFFDLKTGRLNQTVWKEYLNWDPVHRIQKLEDAASSIKFILLDAGLQDEFSAQWGHRQIHEELLKKKIPSEISEFSGKHSGHNWRFLERVRKLISKMDAT